ncbi:hypothetical protein R69746_05609 [Paraburkholderia aspalathi]|uniref:hypothetical protein n=1 Tax=Paraburkholderia aspalathi TaxID=1324617 RepID=UPI00190B0E7D|nr:hypothetical protein [Paraburkholderia aspalathi]MBK3841763.1 hypothetical protein [Paraburkholderia aspalathi]CAE6810801.1 hypothetical protein R69746_05609 [Paraburkholderia aspalathi]
MKIHEILAVLADDEVSMQGLNAAIIGIRATKSGNAVTFLTDGLSPADLIHGSDKVVIALFIKREAWDRERAKERS